MAVIVVVDDEVIVIQVVRMALEHVGHTIHTASSGTEADRIAATIHHMDVLIVDHWIPPETGRVIAERLLRRHTTARVMHISGYPREHLEAEGNFFPGASFLAKPFRIEQMQESVAMLLAA